MTKHSIAKFCILTAGILALPTLSFAGKEIVSKDKNPVEVVKESCITGDLGVNVVSQYISRGLIFENQGGIIQPYADLYFRLYQGDGFINKVSANVGIWNSFHSRHTDAGEAVGRGTGRADASSTRSWYEFDFTAGLAVTFLKNFTLTPSYYTFLSPNDGFNTFQGLNVNLAYDDTDLLGKFALHPHVTVLWELENKAGNGSDEGVYYEVGIAPSTPLGKDTGLTLTLPITAGFGSNEFYARNAGFGYFSAGAQVSYALAFVPKCLGAWTVNSGATYYYLGSQSLRDFNTAPANDVRDAKNSEWVFSGGLAVSF
jgi:hypothetical protein